MNQSDLRRLQAVELDILKVVDRICRENDIKYFLVGGTLLGAERHKGFIPWDDDLDIALLRDDYNKFIKLCNSGALGRDYFLHHISTDTHYWLPFAKIRKNNTLFDEISCSAIKCHKGIFIDVFPLDYCRKNKGIMYHLRAKVIKKISYIILLRGLNWKAEDMVTAILYRLTYNIEIDQLAKMRDKLCEHYRDGPYIINYGSNYKYTKQTMPRSIYEPATELLFEDRKFLVPHLHEKYLELLFSNWRELPPEEERRNHNPSRIIFNLKGQV